MLQAGQDFFPFLNLETRKADYWKIFQVELLGLVGERGDPKFNPLPAVQEWIHPKFWISDTVFYALRHPHIWQYVPYLGRDAANEIFQWPFWNFGYASADEYKMEILKGFKLPYPQMTSAIEKANDEYQKKSWMFVGPYRFSMFLVKEDEAETYTNIAHAAFAARRYYQKHNHWPFTVKDLDGNQADYLDPYTDGEGLRIDAYPRGIVIYCQSPYYSNWSNFHPDFSKGYQRDFPAWILQSKQNSAGQEEVNEGVQAIRNKDYLHAMNSFQKAAALGNATGETDIGYLYQNGQGVPKDWVEALKWHKKAAWSVGAVLRALSAGPDLPRGGCQLQQITLPPARDGLRAHRGREGGGVRGPARAPRRPARAPRAAAARPGVGRGDAAAPQTAALQAPGRAQSLRALSGAPRSFFDKTSA